MPATSPSDDVSSPVTDAASEPTFAELDLRPELLAVLDELGYEEPTPIQLEAIPPALQGRDLVGQAATGTGKTAAFALPLLHRLATVEDARDAGAPGTPRALVVTPTRELAMQVSQAIHRYGQGLGVRVLPVYGGQPIWKQLKSLERGVDVVVGTPGRLIDHLDRGTLQLGAIEAVVLDEADEMLDMGFVEDIERILGESPDWRQTLLFSATMPPRIEKLARRHLGDPLRITIDREQQVAADGALVEQRAYVVQRAHKAAALGRLLDLESPEATIVFCGTRVEVESLTRVMNGRGHRAEALHGGMTQQQRDQVMGRLRDQSADLLIATDVAARGLDIDHLTHVVNHDVPSAPESYVHRIGRVGRAGREGIAITLVEPRQHRLLKAIERHTGQSIPVEQVPTVADLREARTEMTRAAIRETLLDGDTDHARAVVDALADEFDIVQIAVAAVAVAHDALGGDTEDEQELPPARLHTDPAHGGGNRGKGGAAGKGGPPPGDMGRIWVGLGRAAGMRPKDLVGAIANETSLKGRDIGAIQITQRFSLVDVPAASVDEVISSLRATTIRGRRPSVRPDRGHKPRS